MNDVKVLPRLKFTCLKQPRANRVTVRGCGGISATADYGLSQRDHMHRDYLGRIEERRFKAPWCADQAELEKLAEAILHTLCHAETVIEWEKDQP